MLPEYSSLLTLVFSWMIYQDRASLKISADIFKDTVRGPRKAIMYAAVPPPNTRQAKLHTPVGKGTFFQVKLAKYKLSSLSFLPLTELSDPSLHLHCQMQRWVY